MFTRYVILLSMNPGKEFTPDIIKEHVDFLKGLEQEERLVLCGPFTDYEGGMIIIKANSLDEAKQIAESDPFVSQGIESYEVRTWELACQENNYMLRED